VAHATEATLRAHPLGRAWTDYIGGDSKIINHAMRADDGRPDNVSPTTVSARNLLELHKQFAEPSPAVLFRGAWGTAAERASKYEVGQTFSDKGFNSWSAHPQTAGFFSGMDDPSNTHSVAFILKSKGVKGLQGNRSESESILAPGVEYRITGIREWVTPLTVRRVIEMEVA
jgi:hypothetical protein